MGTVLKMEHIISVDETEMESLETYFHGKGGNG